MTEKTHPLPPPLADEKGLSKMEPVNPSAIRPGTYYTLGPIKLYVSRVAKLFLIFALTSYSFWRLWMAGYLPLGHQSRICPADLGVEDVIGGGIEGVGSYWSGIAAKGWKKAVKSGKEHHAHHDKHGKHGHHHHHGHHDHHKHDHHKHGGDMKIIYPRMAEKIFLGVPNNESVRAASRRYTDHAHIAGSGWDYLDALTLKAEWEAALGIPVSGPEDFVFEAGSNQSQERVLNASGKIGVWVDTYYPTMNTPVSSFVTLHSDPPFHAKLQEDIVEGDPDSVLRDEVRVFHGLSVSGHVKGQYVYVGYGRKKDFELLAEKGIDLKGKVVLTKYGGVFRGLKVKAAQEAGAVGVLIYSDPGDDGKYTEEQGYEAYPEGPARQPSSVQRGSVQFLSKYPGDPATPGLPAYRNASRSEGGNFPDIPSLPLSYEDAIPLLMALNGKGSKVSDYGQEWVGGLEYKGVEYWTGPSEVELEMKNEVNTRVMPIWNTMATIPGHISDEVVVVGNHRDAWVLGAADPSSGTASMYEMVRGLGVLLQQGWKPLRTIVLASWDAEEYGLIGSTEWTEDFGDWLSTHAVAYLNMDVAASGGRFRAEASPSLSWLIRNAAEEVFSSSNNSASVWDTRTSGNDWETWRAQKQGFQRDLAEVSTSGRDSNWVKPLGSGSDFTSFLQRFGIASTNTGFAAGPEDPVYHYHSVYDSFFWQDKFADKGFHMHVDAAKVFGLMTLRMADSMLLPINTTQYSLELIDYLNNVQYIAMAGNYSSSLDLKSLNHSIHELINSSLALDHHKSQTVKKLIDLLPKPKKHKKKGSLSRLSAFLRGKSGCHGSRETKNSMSLWTPRSDAQEVEKIGWPDLPHLPHIPGLPHPDEPKEPKEPPHHPHPPPPPPPPPHEPPSHPHPPHPPHHPTHPHLPPTKPRHPHIPKKDVPKIKHLLEEIRAINHLLQQFEGGFISQAGIPDREWYRHKGVAPGKWLGYGATTFPALTEALTIERSAKRAQEEADDLAQMIKKMAEKLDKATGSKSIAAVPKLSASTDDSGELLAILLAAGGI